MLSARMLKESDRNLRFQDPPDLSLFSIFFLLSFTLLSTLPVGPLAWWHGGMVARAPHQQHVIKKWHGAKTTVNTRMMAYLVVGGNKWP